MLTIKHNNNIKEYNMLNTNYHNTRYMNADRRRYICTIKVPISLHLGSNESTVPASLATLRVHSYNLHERLQYHQNTILCIKTIVSYKLRSPW